MLKKFAAHRSHQRVSAPTRSRRVVAVVASVATLSSSAIIAGAPAAVASPTIPDNVPNIVRPFAPEVEENPQIYVTLEDGSPVTAPVHRGDVLLVHGSGFDPNANRGGFPLPVPAGVPNGVYVLYSGFPDHWKPSEGADPATRLHPHDRMAWVMPPKTLDYVPGTVTNMQRSLARVAQPMDGDGNFVARIVVDPPENTPGDNFGVYTYAAAGSVNAAEELYVPIPFSPEPGPNTPPASSPDLVFEVATLEKAFDALGGGVKAKQGATALDDGRLAFSYDGEEAVTDGSLVYSRAKYRGVANMTARFGLVDIVVKDPWMEFHRAGYGSYDQDVAVITALVSRSYDVGPDELVRVPIAVVNPLEDATQPGTLNTTVGPIQRVK